MPVSGNLSKVQTIYREIENKNELCMATNHKKANKTMTNDLRDVLPKTFVDSWGVERRY